MTEQELELVFLEVNNNQLLRLLFLVCWCWFCYWKTLFIAIKMTGCFANTRFVKDGSHSGMCDVRNTSTFFKSL